MDIVYKNRQFKIKAKTGVLYIEDGGVVIESLDGSSKKKLSGPGEYEVSGISVIGLQTDGGSIFVYEIDGLRICSLGNLAKKLTDATLSSIGAVDILIFEVGETSFEKIQQIECHHIIPFGQKNEEDLDKFLKESGLSVVKMPKFSLKKEDLIEDSSMQIILLGK